MLEVASNIEKKKHPLGALAFIFPFVYTLFDAVSMVFEGVILNDDSGETMGEIDFLILEGLMFLIIGIYFTGTQYFIAVYLFIMCIKHVRKAISELSDKTLPETEQMKILKVITKHDDEYSSFGSIKSRYNGAEVIIDISMSFSQSTTYSEIAALQKAMQEELSGEIENCHISIVID